MKKLSFAVVIAVITSLLIATAAFASFTNGNFENGDFTGWTKDATFLNGGILVGPPPSYVPVPVASVSGALVVDDTFIVNTAWMDTNFGSGVKCDPVTDGTTLGTGEVCLPFAGSDSAVVNYLGGYNAKNNNMNTLSQSGLMAGSDLGADGKYHLFFAFAPVLDIGIHSAADQPFMHVKLTRQRSGVADKTLFDQFSYPADLNPNWKQSKTTTSVYYMNWQVYDLAYNPADLTTGDTISILVTAAGCIYTQGGHWGYVYVDEFGAQAPAGNTSPSISALTPPSGPIAGGTTVTLTGVRFTGATAVTIGGNVLTAGSFTIVNDTTITFVTPAHAAGVVDVQVTNPSGSAIYPNGFTYTAVPAPTITSIVPNSGPITGGTTVVITGTDLTGGSVTIGGTPATCTVDSPTQITCTTPAHPEGPADVVVTTPGGTATLPGGFTYTTGPLPTITELVPEFGPVTGGTEVVIVGTNFVPGTTVTFGGIAATCAIDSETQLTCTTPAHEAGPVDVVVTTSGGPATFTNGFTYYKYWAIFYSDGKLDGWVKESYPGSGVGSQVNTLANIPTGDNYQNRAFRSIISFNTKRLPDNAVIQAAQVRINLRKFVGNSPFAVLGKFYIDIKKGPFGLAALEITDFQARASARRVANFNKALSGTKWYNASLNATGLKYINLKGLTQMRLYFAKATNRDFKSNHIRYWSGNRTVPLSKRPQLIVYYTLP